VKEEGLRSMDSRGAEVEPVAVQPVIGRLSPLPYMGRDKEIPYSHDLIF
jgi:hypothetical protein